MWREEAIGTAHWRRENHEGVLRAPGGGDGIGWYEPQHDRPRWTLEPVGGDMLPVAAEQFVRGEALHVRFPQGRSPYGMELVVRPLDVPAGRLVLELTIAIETTLLESHPTIDLCSGGEASDQDAEYHAHTPAGQAAGALPPAAAASVTTDREGPGQRAEGISKWSGQRASVACLLGPRDYPWTIDLSDARQLRLRLFGDFLEKGVIRKARPWVVLDPGSGSESDAALRRAWEQLCQAPLPLLA